MSRRAVGFWLILVPELVLFYASLWLAVLTRYGSNIDSQLWGDLFRSFSIIFLIWLLVSFMHGLYEISSLRRYTTLIFTLLSATLVNFLVAVVYFYFQPSLLLTPRRFLLLVTGFSFLLLLVWRLLIKYLLKNRLVTGLYLFSFAGELNDLENEINNNTYLGFRVLGHLNEQSLGDVILRKDDGIVLPDNLHANPKVLAKFYDLRKSGVAFYNHKTFYENLLRRVYLSQINEVWFLENINYQEKRFYNLIKRGVDILLGIILFIGFLLSLPICYFMIKIFSPGPLMFTQTRVGKKGKFFNVYKYRTMQGATTNTWTSVNDPRITKIGKFLRKSRIDEWPQSINLLLGNMSLVGPRPEQPHLVEHLKTEVPFYDERHLVKPGLTGWAQLNIYAANIEESKAKLQYDLYYIKNRSFLFDLEIILKTVYYIFTWQGR